MNYIKNPSLIVASNVTDNKTTYIIKNGCKLSDVFHFLPSGMICKDATGMGATHLELEAPRPSIIVEPLKVTASSKAHKHKAIYYGGETIFHNKIKPKYFLSQLRKLPIEKRKIVIVADNLSIIKQLLKEEFNDYFLMIDEVDSFQIDSSFRISMSICFDIYLNHPKKNRALVTATPLKFSNPLLKDELVTSIEYEKPECRNITLIHSDELLGSTVDAINKILYDYPQDKIMIAYNSISRCTSIMKHLEEKAEVPSTSLGILCGLSNKDKVATYYKELNGETLPVQINFITSAYFTGYDLNEKYHLICVSDGCKTMYQLSEHRIKQIVGRCREGVLSETIIYSLSDNKIEIPDLQKLTDAAEEEITALTCLTKHYKNNKHLEGCLINIRNMIVDSTVVNDTQFVRIDINDVPAINYLSIDSFFERCRVQNEIYQNYEQLALQLRKAGNAVSLNLSASATNVQTLPITKIPKQHEINEITNKLLTIDENDFQELLQNGKNTNLERFVLKVYVEFSGFLMKEDIIKIIKFLNKQDRRAFNNIVAAARFAILDKDNFIKRAITFHIKIDKKYSQKDLLTAWKNILTETGILKDIHTENKAVQMTKLYFKTSKDKRKGTFTILKENPFEFNILKYKK